jgi:prepilin-type N-terminal cleavage/methylation domain-containing protein
MLRLKNNRGYTMIEMMTVLGLFGGICSGTMAMMISGLKSSNGSCVKAYTDADAVSAMTTLVQDVREAKSVTILDGGDRLNIVPPVRTSDNYYDRSTPDTTNQIQYYLSDSTGTIGKTGTWLWRTCAGRSGVVKRTVSNLLFEQDTAMSVKITIDTSGASADGTKQTELTQRVVYLRNY